ncbi:helicase-associated domain-containing protein [Microbacterium halotolerans]|uniref:helicase-associated domain-containing protein n=1 Tax=Microbacterium halotolerans TaxID=246613 RepID=UPI000E6AD121|nr:helicase-associated domain-containing protein [Microbacterium halotolerans]
MTAVSAEARVRSLAERLSVAGDEEIASLFSARGVSAHASWRDWFDAADALLSPDSVTAAVSALPRDVLCDLREGAGGERLGLTDADGRPYAPVLMAIPDGLSRTPTTAPVAASQNAAAHAAERAFTGMSAMAEVMLDGMRTPMPRVGERLGANERRRLTHEGIVHDPDEADVLVQAAETAGLVRADDRRWLVTSAGAEWTRADTPHRWERLVLGLRSAIPDGLRPAAGASGWVDPALWPDAYPLAATWPEAADRWRRMFELAGLIAADGEPTWARPLREGRDADPSALLALLPAEVDRVFLQNDLTAISPGTLSPPLDVRLRAMAVRESHAQASTYRFTEGSVSSALGAGETSESISAFLRGLSITGVPQPLAYLIDRTAERHGLVRVSLEPETGRTIVSSPDHHLVATIAVDQSLRALGLTADGALLRTRADRRAVFWALSDARYPVVAIDEAGETIVLDRSKVAPDAAPAEQRHRPLIERLRESEADDTDTAWLERELNAAVKGKSTLVVSVAMPDGSTRELTLEATGMGGGRLRGLDRGADVERTLPVSSITAVRPA